jgi:hypothetical protein
MATARGDKWGRNRPIAIILPPQPGCAHEDNIVESLVPRSLKNMSPTYTFETLVGQKKKQTESDLNGARAMATKSKSLPAILTAGSWYGWVEPVNSLGGSRKEHDHGYTSDGLEIVALIAHNDSWSMAKGFRFAAAG